MFLWLLFCGFDIVNLAAFEVTLLCADRKYTAHGFFADDFTKEIDADFLRFISEAANECGVAQDINQSWRSLRVIVNTRACLCIEQVGIAAGYG